MDCCYCGCTFTASLPDGTEEVFPQFVQALKFAHNKGFKWGAGDVRFRRNTEECPCLCFSCLPSEAQADLVKEGAFHAPIDEV